MSYMGEFNENYLNKEFGLQTFTATIAPLKDPKIQKTIKSSTKMFEAMKKAGRNAKKLTGTFNKFKEIANMPFKLGKNILDGLASQLVAPISASLTTAIAGITVPLTQALAPIFSQIGQYIGGAIQQNPIGGGIGGLAGGVIGGMVGGLPGMIIGQTLGGLVGAGLEKPLQSAAAGFAAMGKGLASALSGKHTDWVALAKTMGLPEFMDTRAEFELYTNLMRGGGLTVTDLHRLKDFQTSNPKFYNFLISQGLVKGTSYEERMASRRGLQEGGIAQKHGLYELAEGNKREAVIPLRKENTFKNLERKLDTLIDIEMKILQEKEWRHRL